MSQTEFENILRQAPESVSKYSRELQELVLHFEEKSLRRDRSDKEFGSSRNLMAGIQDVGFLRYGLLRPVSERLMPGKRERAEHQPHHWRAIDRNIPSQAHVPALHESVFPGIYKFIGVVPEKQNYWTQEQMPGKSTTLDPRIDRSDCGFHATNSRISTAECGSD